MSSNYPNTQGTVSHTVEASPIQNSCFGNVLERLRRFFRRGNTTENSRLSVQAVDSVRLVYMRRILHNSISENTYSSPLLFQNTTTEYESPSTMSIAQEAPLLRRRKSNRPTLEALELALKTYESKHKNILQHTAPPNEKYLSVESITSGFNKKHVGSKQLKRKSKTDLVEFEIAKTDLNIITATNRTTVIVEGVNMEGDKIKPRLDTQKPPDDDEEEEKNVCFDVESVSFDSTQDDYEISNHNNTETAYRKKVSINTEQSDIQNI